MVSQFPRALNTEVLTFLPLWALMINTFSEWTAWCGTDSGDSGDSPCQLWQLLAQMGFMLVGSRWKFEVEIILKIGGP